MNTRKMLSIALVLVAGLLLVLSGVILAQTGGDYNLTWHTVDGGGAVSGGGNFTLMGTAGQPEPGPALTSGDYTLYSGFWPGAGEAGPSLDKHIYLPLVLRNS